MNICVVTPYYQESRDALLRAHASVKAQTIEARHILVCDGSEPAQIPDFQGTHIVLPTNHGDDGNIARLIGCYNAITREAEAIAFLDPVDWYYPDHLRSLTAIATSTRINAVGSARMLHRPDGVPVMKCSEVDGENHFSPSCLIVTRPAFSHLIAWAMQGHSSGSDAALALWTTLRNSGVPLAFVDRPSVAHEVRERTYADAPRSMPQSSAWLMDRAGAMGAPVLASHTLTTNPAALGAPWDPHALMANPRRLVGPALFRDGIAEHHAALIEPLFNLPAVLPHSAWAGHIPFLFALFRMLRPATFVELGVHTGASLIAAASAAAAYQVPTQLVGIDTFLGDEHAGQYDGDRMYGELLAYLSRTFPSVRLERSAFADAAPLFPSGSIDVLHIDGLHTYEAVRSDFETWFDRVSAAGVILMHDIEVRERGFGVHLLWEDLRARLPTLEFSHSHGLGVILLAPDDDRLRPLAALMRDVHAMRAYRGLVAEVARVLPERMAGRFGV